MKRLIFPLLCVFLTAMVSKHHQEVNAFWGAMRGAHPAWLLLGAFLQIGTLWNQPAFFQSLYALVGLEARWRDLVTVVLAGRFLNVVTPAAGLGETALLFEQARRRGWEGAKVTLVTTLYFALNFAVFGLILVTGLALLWYRGDLESSETVPAITLLLGLALALSALVWIARKPASFSDAMQRLVLRVPQRWQKGILAPAMIGAAALRFAASLGEIRTARTKLVRPLLHALLVDALEIAVLAVCLMAFGVAVTLPMLIVSYAVGTLFTVVSISPQGLGAVEGAMVATLCSLGVPLPAATVTVLAYRGLSFWLPLVVGFVVARLWVRNLTSPQDFPVGWPPVIHLALLTLK